MRILAGGPFELPRRRLHPRRQRRSPPLLFRQGRAASQPRQNMTTPKRVAVLQSSYIPWKGYFDIIHDVDTFIFYDDVQFTYQDWRSRNRIIANGDAQWLTVPTGSSIDRLIHEVALPDARWQRK